MNNLNHFWAHMSHGLNLSFCDLLMYVVCHRCQLTTFLSTTSSPYTPNSARIIFVPRVHNGYFWLIDRTSAKQSGTCGQSQIITWEDLGQSPKSYDSRVPKEWSATVFKHVQKQKAIKTCRPLVVLVVRVLSRSPCLACPLELSYTLWSSLLPSGAFVYPLQLSAEDCATGVTKNW